MSTVKIIDNNDNDRIAYEGPAWGATDALVNLVFKDAVYDEEVYDACERLGDAIAKGEPTYELEAYLGVTVE